VFNKNRLDSNINNEMGNISNKVKKPFFKSWKGKALIVFIVLGFIGSLGNDETTKDTPTDETQEQAKTEQTNEQEETAAETATEPVVEEPIEPELTPEQIAEQLHTEWVEAQFSAWDGSHTALKDLIKENMNDPKSFEHVETKFLVLSTQELVDTVGQGEIGDMYVYMKFRGNNAFGGLVLNEVEALSSYKNNYITIISQN